MQILRLSDGVGLVPNKYTGIAEYPGGTKRWYKEGKLHRTDGPAIEYPDGTKEWWIEGKEYRKLALTALFEKEVFLSKEIGKHGLVWYRFFTETGIEEIPLIPGMAIPIGE